MDKHLFANDAHAHLASALPAGETTMTLDDASPFPAPGQGECFYATLYEVQANGEQGYVEVVKVTSRSGNVLTVQRDVESMTGNSGGRSYPSTPGGGVICELRLTAGVMQNMLQEHHRGQFAAAGHGHTKDQVGLERVDNTPDGEKPVSGPQQQAINAAVEGVKQEINVRVGEVKQQVDGVNQRVSEESARITAVSVKVDALPVPRDKVFFNVNGTDGTVAHDTTFSTPLWNYVESTIHDLGGGRWAMRAVAPGRDAHAWRTIDGLVMGQWYTATIELEFTSDVAEGVSLLARQTNHHTMSAGYVSARSGRQYASVSFRMTGSDGRLLLIIDPAELNLGDGLILYSCRVAPGSEFVYPVLRDNRAGFPMRGDITRHLVNLAEEGMCMAPDGTLTASLLRGTNPGQDSYIQYDIPNLVPDKVAITAAIWVRPSWQDDRMRLKFLQGDHTHVATGAFVDTPARQWTRLTLRGDFTGASGNDAILFVDSELDSTLGRRQDFCVWGLTLDTPLSPTPFASLQAQVMQGFPAGSHVVITGPGSGVVSLPRNPREGDTVWVSVTNSRRDNAVWGDGENVMGAEEVLLLDMGDATYRFLYMDKKRGWWIV